MKEKRNGWLAIYLVIAAVMFVGMVIFSGRQEFWYDEVYQIGLVKPGLGFKDVLTEYMQLKDYTPPLYALMAYVWIRLVPFSFRYLLLISEAMTAAGVFLCGLAGEHAGGKKMGLLAELFAAFSAVLVLSAGYEFRSYALYFMASALVLFLRVKRFRTGQDGRDIRYFLALGMLLYSHYYGSILAAVMFGIELLLVLAKQQKPKILIPYLGAGCGFLPWLLLVFFNRTRSISEFWIKPPDLRSLYELAVFLCSDSRIVTCILCLSLAAGVARIVYRVAKGSFAYEKDGRILFLVGVIFGVTGIMYLYGAVINPSGGIFYNRYFIGLLPSVFLLMAEFVTGVTDKLRLCGKSGKRIQVIVICVLAVILFAQNGNTFWEDISKAQKISYVSSSRELCGKDDIREPETVIVTTDNPYVRAGVEMYCQKLFQTDVKVISQYDEGFADQIGQYEKVYLFFGKQSLTEESRQIFDSFEQIGRDKKNRIREYVNDQGKNGGK